MASMNPFLEDTMQALFDLHVKGRDECSIKLALKKLNRNSKSLIPYNGPKCKNIVREKTYEGTILLVKSPSSVDKLLELFTEAITYAQNDSFQLAIAYQNRSVILCDVGLYEDSLMDIDRALSLNYPDNSIAKLYQRKALSLSAIAPEKRTEIDDYIAKALHWRVKMSNLDKKLLDWSLKELSTDGPDPEPFKKPGNSFITPDIRDANEKLIGASSAIELKYSEQFGRHIIATRDINAGETLIKQKAYASIINRTGDRNINQRLLYCWNCSKHAFSSVPCKHCTCIVFCDENCRDEAWENYHDIECSILSYILTPNTLDIVLMGLKLTIKALKEAGSIELLREKLQKLDSVSDPLTRGFTGGKLDGTKYDSIYTLTPDTHCNYNPETYVAWITNTAHILFVWANTTETFGVKVDNMHQLIDNEAAIFIGAVMIKNMRISLINMQIAVIYDVTKIHASRTMISSLIGRINHSCDQNACLVYSNDTVVVNSIQMIKKGEQIFINYILEDGVPLKRPAIQNQYLKHKYNFECKCDICQESLDPGHPPLTSFEDHILPSNIMQMLQIMAIEFRMELLNCGPVSGSFKYKKISLAAYASRLSYLLNILGKYVHQPCVETRILKLFLKRSYMQNNV